jgi:hypothetical protein
MSFPVTILESPKSARKSRQAECARRQSRHVHGSFLNNTKRKRDQIFVLVEGWGSTVAGFEVPVDPFVRVEVF